MYYSAIGLLALLILLIENSDILLNRNDAFRKPAWKAYRRFLFAVLIYYVTDILWGVIEDLKMARLLFIDTSVYFIVMAAGVLFWTQYVVTYLGRRSRFGGFFVGAGRVIALAVTVITVINIFTPILFEVDGNCVYRALPVRYAVLIIQIALLLLISVRAVIALIRWHDHTELIRKYRTLALFGLVMALFLGAQLWFPYLPLYSIAYLLGTSLLRAFVIGDEKEEYRQKLEETEKLKKLEESFAALLHNMPALSFSKDAKTGVYTACNQAFAEYAKKESPEQVIGLTDADIFDEETARHFTKDDRLALSMDEPYIFYEDVPDAAGSQRQFQTTKLKYTDPSGRLCLLGMCQDVTETVRIRREAERMEEERMAYTRMNALLGDFLCVYVVEPQTGRYREYSATAGFETFMVPKEGEDFFGTSRVNAHGTVHPDDLDRFLSLFTEQIILAEIGHSGTFSMSYRLILAGKPTYVRLRAAIVEEREGKRLIVGISNIDAHVRQEEEYARQLEQAQSKANLDALTGVKNKLAFLNAEERLNRQIAEQHPAPFAIVILDVNDLKRINDTIGHSAGDDYLRGACRIICDVFKHSPVFRVGGDEFAVIAQNTDYACIEELLGRVKDHNAEALRTGGIVIACGMAKFDNDASVTAVFERADQAMYRNKSRLKAGAGQGETE